MQKARTLVNLLVIFSFLLGLIIFGVCGIVEVVVSMFTTKVPREELGGLTWPTINERPISHGAIGEEGSAMGSGGNKYELSHIPQDTTANGVEMGRFSLM